MITSRKSLHLLVLLGCGLAHANLASSQDLRFYADPYQVYQGDVTRFWYKADTSTVPLTEIKSWKWDFDGDGIWDEQKTVDPDNGVSATAINTRWVAGFGTQDPVDGVLAVRPRLEITKTDNSTIENPSPGVTEDVFGVDSAPDPEVIITERGVGDSRIIVNFSANPRLALPGDTVRLYSDVEFQEEVTGQVLTYDWDLDGDGSFGDSSAANPTIVYSPDSTTEYDIALKVTYSVSAPKDLAVNGLVSPTETKRAFVRVHPVATDLQFGRAYRRGFPETIGWDDIITAYQALGPGNNRYVYFDHLQDAFDSQKNKMAGTAAAADPDNRREMAEVVNELIQGQTLVANQRLIEALRIKYPRLSASIDPDEDRLNPPAGAREETAAIDQAVLDYQLPITYAFAAVADFGPDILRAGALEGAEPYPQFPQYIKFTDSTLSQTDIPIRNEYWQLSTAFERMALGRMEKAKKLYRLSVQDETARDESKQECKATGIQSYLGMALLASGQTENEFQKNEGNLMLAHLKNARNLFEQITEGLDPLGNDGSFIPNESFSAIYQDAQEAVGDAREAEINARQEERNWERYQAELRSEHLSQRNNYLTPLKNLTSIDPALYNNLNTAEDQRDYRSVVNSRVEALLEDYPNGNPRVVGELGANVIALLDAGQSVEAATNNLTNLLKRVELQKWSNAEVNAIIDSTSRKLRAADMLLGAAEGWMSTSFGLSTDGGLAALGGLLKGAALSTKTFIQTAQTLAVNDIQLEREIRGMLLETGNLGIAIDRANNSLAQAQLSLDNQLARMDRLIEDLAHTRDTAADLYFQDPSFQIVVSDAMRRAESELDYAVDRLYRLAKTLEYEWTEAYQNPLIIPVNSFEPASLENPLFDKFPKLDSLFFIRGADESKDYLDALKAWDSKLRRINVTSVRGPNHSGPISAEPISVRETILNLRPDSTRGYTLDDSIRDFRNHLETQREENFYNPNNPTLELNFQTTIEDNRFFPATGSRWNMRLHSIAVDIYAESGFSDKQVAEIDLIQSGVTSLRRYWAELPGADDLMKFTFNVDDIDRTAFAIALPAKVNGTTGNRPPTEFENLGLKNRPVAATNWILRINTEGTTNQNIDFSKLKDIVLRYTYTFGNPPEFTNF